VSPKKKGKKGGARRGSQFEPEGEKKFRLSFQKGGGKRYRPKKTAEKKRVKANLSWGQFGRGKKKGTAGIFLKKGKENPWVFIP